MKTQEPVRWLTAVFSGAQVLLASTAVLDILGPVTVGMLLAVSASIQVAAGEFVRSRVTPVD